MARGEVQQGAADAWVQCYVRALVECLLRTAHAARALQRVRRRQLVGCSAVVFAKGERCW